MKIKVIIFFNLRKPISYNLDGLHKIESLVTFLNIRYSNNWKYLNVYNKQNRQFVKRIYNN